MGRLGVERVRHENLTALRWQTADDCPLFRIVPQGRPARDDGQRLEVIGRRRGLRRPLQCLGAPRVPFGRSAAPAADRDVDQEEKDRNSHDAGADRRGEIESAPTPVGKVRIDAARHPVEPELVHRKERQVEADEEKPEVPEPETAVKHPSGHLREPEIQAAKKWKHRAADQDIVEVRDDEERVVHLQVHRNGREHYSGQPADQEREEEAEHEKKRRIELRPALPERRDPAEHLNARRDRDHEARGGEEALPELRQSGREHVVDPEPES